VEGGDELRHRGHRDRRAVTRPIAPPIEDRDADLGQRGDRMRDERRAHRQRHAEHAEAIAAPAARRVGSPRSARMKQTPATR
jgi:hypothetical protein